MLASRGQQAQDGGMKTNATVENTAGLSHDEVVAVTIMADTINNPDKCRSLDDAAQWLKCLAGWFVYRGGSHVALHKASGEARRILFVTEGGVL
jgi:hypothetical protein